MALDRGELVQALRVGEQRIRGLGVLGVEQPLECAGQAHALEGRCHTHPKNREHSGLLDFDTRRNNCDHRRMPLQLPASYHSTVDQSQLDSVLR